MSSFKKINPEHWIEFRELEKLTFANDELNKESFLIFINEDGFFGLFEDFKLIGYIFCKNYGNYNHLHRIAVDPNFQGKGYGSILMNKAINYFSKFNLPEITLYVETHNESALRLYKKHNFEIKNESWHFILHTKDFRKINEAYYNDNSFSVLEFDLKSIMDLKNTFPSINSEEILFKFKEQEKLRKEDRTLKFLGLFVENSLQTFAIFNQSFSGCRPFVYTDIKYVDSFIYELLKYRLPEKNVLRLTFDNYNKLAELFKKRGYLLYHHLYKMVKDII